jgi:hypothetical protein
MPRRSSVQKFVKGKVYKTGDVVRFANGAEGLKLSNGRWRLAATKGFKFKKSSHTRRQVSPRSAVRSMHKYYKGRTYSSQAKRRLAVLRDICHKGRSVVTDSKYTGKTGPARHDYKGLDDGSRCVAMSTRKRSSKGLRASSGHKMTSYAKKTLTKQQRSSLLRRLRAARRARLAKLHGGERTMERTEMNQEGGRRAVNLKTAVELLRKYYTEKYTGGRKSMDRTMERTEMKQEGGRRSMERTEMKQEGARRAVSLKTAVNLLRKYYTEKYSR